MRKAISLANGHSPRTLPPHHAQIRTLSDRLVDAQRPIRILDAIKWDDGIECAFFAKGCKELPAVTSEYYANRPLPFEPRAKSEEFRLIEHGHVAATTPAEEPPHGNKPFAQEPTHKRL